MAEGHDCVSTGEFNDLETQPGMFMKSTFPTLTVCRSRNTSSSREADAAQ